MLKPVPPSDCSTAREAASALIDGELSELEAAHLDGHLRDCADCSAYARELGALAARLRAEPLERPALPIFTARRRSAFARPLGRLQVAAAAATILVATGSSFAVGQLVGSHGGPPAATVGTTIADASSTRQVELLGMLRRHGPARGEIGRVIPV